MRHTAHYAKNSSTLRNLLNISPGADTQHLKVQPSLGQILTPELNYLDKVVLVRGASWLSRAHQRLRKIRKLECGWDSYGAQPPNLWAVYWAEAIITEAWSLGFEGKVVASAEGGVALCFRSGTKYADIECLNSKKILAVKSDGLGHTKAWELGQDAREIKLTLQLLKDFLRV